MPELLSPAGNFQKMVTALRYGADAVYLAYKSFGMRSAADNFTLEELYKATELVHQQHKKIYLTLNTLPRWNEYEELEELLYNLKGCHIDALIIADPGVLSLARELLPESELHISTQAGVVSHRDCDFWQKQGATRVVLARELSFEDIAEIKKRISKELELEAFIHGSMCVSFSGRCLLSENLIGRDANRGACAQPCRWNYNLFEIAEEKRPGMRFPIEETDRGSFIMSSKDLCMIEHIRELYEAGIASFKIEGRMKSAYYAAVTANTYKMAMNAYEKDPSSYHFDNRLMTELCSVSHREYSTGYFFEKPIDDAKLTANNGYIREKAYLAVAESYDPITKRATFIQRNKAFNNSVAELLTPGQVGRKLLLSDMRNEEGEEIESAPHPFMKFSVNVPFEVKEGDILRGSDEKEQG